MHILLQFKYLAYLFQCWDFFIIIKSYHVIKLSPCLEKKCFNFKKGYQYSQISLIRHYFLSCFIVLQLKTNDWY